MCLLLCAGASHGNPAGDGRVDLRPSRSSVTSKPRGIILAARASLKRFSTLAHFPVHCPVAEIRLWIRSSMLTVVLSLVNYSLLLPSPFFLQDC